MGSGMGTLMEALWGYYTNQVLRLCKGHGIECEIGWLSGHEYNDFACVSRDAPWVQATRAGELFRIEAKSMNAGADESKGHFDELVTNLGDFDLLLVLVWSWDSYDDFRVYPRIRDHFIGPARAIATLRDALHIARGGSFVSRDECPEKCHVDACGHHGEPLNARGRRERLSGPPSCRPSAQVSYAANFGGLVRMLKTDSEEARRVFRKLRKEDATAHAYISFLHRSYPAEEKNQYLTSEWRLLAENLGIRTAGMPRDAIISAVRERPGYQDLLRGLFL